MQDNEDINRSFRKLEERCRALEAETELLAEQTEESHLLGAIAEDINTSDDIDQIIDSALERLSILKNIPFCAAGVLNGIGEFHILHYYASFTGEQPSADMIVFPEAFVRSASAGTALAAEDLCRALKIDALFSSGVFSPSAALTVPLRSRNGSGRMFLFVDTDDSGRLANMTDLLMRLSDLISSKDEHLYLLRELQHLNQELEHKVEIRTAQLARSEQLFRALFEQASDGIFFLDSTGKVIFVNEAFARMHGYTVEEMLRLGLEDLDVESKASVLERMRRIMGGEMLTFEVEHFHKDGHIFPLEVTANFISVGNEQLTIAIHRDITGRKLAEEAVKKNEAFIRNILESVGEGFIVVDRAYRIQSANRAFCQFVKMPAAEIMERHCYEVSHHMDKPCFEMGEQCPVRQVFETGAPHFVSHLHTTEAGIRQYVEAKAYPITDASGAVVSAIETISDVTERKVIEDQLRQAQKMEAVGQLAGGIAHDFNNMLTAIIGYGSLLNARLGKDSELRPFVDQILSSAGRSADLTRQLLAFSRKQKIAPREIDLNELIKGMEKLLLRLIGEDIALTAHLTEKTLVVMVDPGQMEQVLMNISTNARDAMPDGGRLSICTDTVELDTVYVKGHDMEKPGMYALISVTDTGIGLDEKTQQKIFEPFFTTKGVGQGTGLGLSIVYGIIKQHGGNITVYSEPGEGTTFRIYLPLIGSKVEEVKAAETVAPRGGTETVLFVEDNEDARVLSRRVLEEYGYKVIEAVDGEEAVDTFKKNKECIQLVVIDVIMPKKSGKEAIDEIRKIRQDVKVLFTSGYTSDIISRKGILEEGMDFISKPLTPHSLLAKIREILDEQARL
jgi:two-component system cell cycle sensor histidine kinase/response regulator CckA